MSTNVATLTVNGQNGIKANGKIKSKNQLRRLKAKAKKVTGANGERVSAVCHAPGIVVHVCVISRRNH